METWCKLTRKQQLVPEGRLLQRRTLWLGQARGTYADCNNNNWESLGYVLNPSEISNQQDKLGSIGKDSGCRWG